MHKLENLDLFGFKIYGLFFIFLLIIGCKKRVNCDESDDLKLGTIEFSTEFKQWTIEASEEVLQFSNPTTTHILRRNKNIDTTPLRLIESTICESIDIKPYTAYAYYEYENQSTVFSNDSIELLIVIEPAISNENGEQTESIFLTLSEGVSNGIKGRIPVTNVNSIQSEEPFGVLFQFYEDIKIGDRNFSNIWGYKNDTTAIYYSKTAGIIAIEVKEVLFYRDN